MYEDVWDRQELLFKIKIFKDRVDAFESGEQYMRMKKLHQIARAGDFQTIKRLKRELAQERAEKIHVRELWYATCLDMQHEYEKRLAQKDKECEKKLAQKDDLIRRLQNDLQKERAKQEADHEKYLKQVKEAYEAKTQLEEEKEKNRELLSLFPTSVFCWKKRILRECQSICPSLSDVISTPRSPIFSLSRAMARFLRPSAWSSSL